MNINQIQDSIIEDFSMYEDWEDKYEYIIELGKELPEMNEQYKTEENLIKGCQSRVWLHAEEEEGLVKFQADSDAIITKGIIGLLIKIFNNQSAKEISNSDIYFLKEIGLQEHLSPTRANGLVSMVKQIKNYGIAFNLKS
ncbi:MAG: SufE family protein [Chitinophagales bacterium]|nr:SufE family protein [Chitinophagales bacterium]MCZ2392463.1 SufE family protein [Chitinophagales bacterium]